MQVGPFSNIDINPRMRHWNLTKDNYSLFLGVYIISINDIFFYVANEELYTDLNFFFLEN